MRGGPRKNAGRKPVKIDVEDWEKLHAMHCSVEELAGLYSVSTRTIETRLKQRTYAEAAMRGRAKGKISLRRRQRQSAEEGDVRMLIWLGKQMLGQKEVVSNEITGPGGGPIKVATKPDLSKLNEDELRQLREIAARTRPPEGN
jgi:hypothetical protein